MAAVEEARQRAEQAWQAMVAGAEQVTRWTAELDARRAELDALRRRVGETLLADPEAGPQLAAEQQRLETIVVQAEQAAAAGTARLPGLRRAALSARTDWLFARAEVLAEAADAHEQRTRELLGPVAEHEGSPVAEVRWAGLPVSDQLRQTVAGLREQARGYRRLLDRENVPADQVDQRIGHALRSAVEPGHVEREYAGVG